MNGVEGNIGCIDPEGNHVDWFIALKLPRSYNFAYVDVNYPSPLTISSVDLNASNQGISHTLKQIYDNSNSNSVAFALYNDERPDSRTTSSFGHTKGALAFDSTSGFWLLHSVPRWPDFSNQSYEYPERETDFGQSFLCISLNTKSFEDVGKQLMYTNPWIYDSNIPDAFQTKLPTLSSVVLDNAHAGSPYYRVAELTSLGGQKFTSLAKYKTWGQDLYEDLVAPTFRTSLRTETWQNGGAVDLPSFCPPKYAYKVQNVKAVAFKDGGDVSFKNSNDHSKYAVSGPENKVVCIGGINRQESQKKRSGGTVCLQHSEVWAAFDRIITEVESC